MTAKVFLSLSYVDAKFVRAVREQLPHGLAYFYEESFETGELLLSAMERAVADSTIFVLFASPEGLKSPWVGFEISQARIQSIINPKHRILVFPTDSSVSARDLPEWLRSYWVAKAGWGAADIARYVAGKLLEPSSGLLNTIAPVLGRGKSMDKLDQIVADHLQRTNGSPNVYVISGFRGIGRRTFATFYMRTSLTAEANLAYGPTLPLSANADLADLQRALRAEISPTMPHDTALKEAQQFRSLSEQDQISEVCRLITHFSDLRQAIIVYSAAGFFEDRGDLKTWVLPLFEALPKEATLFVVSNRQVLPELVEQSEKVVQVRLDGLDDKDIRALMITTANRLKIDNFKISDALVRAIGGHPEIANAAVRLASVKGTHILERDPRQLFNIQNTILGENVQKDALTSDQHKILSMLGWVPKLNSNLLEQVLIADGLTQERIMEALENLLLGCMITASGSDYGIAPPIRHLYRRFNVTSPSLLKALSTKLAELWATAEADGNLRIDLFDTFLFMHSLEGAALPQELRKLITPGSLADILKEMYSKAKDDSSIEALQRVIDWAKLADGISMSEATREEIMSTLARSQIRAGFYKDAAATIDDMALKAYRSVPFLRGHMLRKQRKYPQAIEFLRRAIDDRKVNRSAVHELALAYKKSGKTQELRELLKEHGHLAQDSAVFQDFQIGVDLARFDTKAVEAGIANLKNMPDDDGRSTIRSAQLLMKWQNFREAKEMLTKLLNSSDKNAVRARAVRVLAAARDKDFELAQKDIDFISQLPNWKDAMIRLEASLLIEKGNPAEARRRLDNLTKGPEDQLLYAHALETEAEMPITSLADRTKFKEQATQIRADNNFALEFDLVD